MSDIFLDLPIKAPLGLVFESVSTPAGLDRWWTKSAAGVPATGEAYELDFGPGYSWRAAVTRCEPDAEFELELTKAELERRALDPSTLRTWSWTACSLSAASAPMDT